MSMRRNICIDGRSAEQVFAETSRRLMDRLGVDAAEDPKTEALIRVFARYCGIIIERLDALPERNYLAFLETLRLVRTQPVPSRVPLSFKAVKGIPAGAPPVVVKKGTQVAAPPKEGNSEPIVFETAREISLTQASLEKVVALEPGLDSYSDQSDLASEQRLPGVPPFSVKTPMPHQLFINHAALFGVPAMSNLKLAVEVPASDAGAHPKRELEWFIVATDGSSIPLSISSDTTEGLSTSGDVVVSGPPEWPLASAFGREGRWLACRLITPGHPGDRKKEPFIGSEEQLSLSLTAHWEPETGPITIGFNNAMALDLSSDFLPLGEHPKLGDKFYFHSALFGVPSTPIEMHFQLTNRNLNGKQSAGPWDKHSAKPELTWQIGNGKTWTDLGADDETDSLTQSGSVRFTVSDTTAAMIVNGEEGFWIRARLLSGTYGKEEKIEYSPEYGPSGFRHFDSTLAPPLIESISMTAGPTLADRLITRNGLIFEEPGVDLCFAPFYRNDDEQAALYLGFRDPATDGGILTKRAIDLYVHVAGQFDQRPCVRESAGPGSSGLRWQYWNGGGWKDSYLMDTSDALRVSGMVSLRAADDIVPWKNSVFSTELFWFRALFAGWDLDHLALLSRISVNTVPATHTLTLEHEVLGSSNGKPGLRYQTARAPIIAGFELEVLESHAASPVQLNLARQRDKGKTPGRWIAWEEVRDLSLSKPSDRHFSLNREGGEVIFGDNVHGRIPPKGVNNIRVRTYRTGGGRAGNTEADSVTQLRSSLPYVDSVRNPIASAGGEDSESIASLKSRGSRWLRHRERAVTAEDYEDLAMMASPTVARAKCYPNRDLSDLKVAKRLMPGTISLAIVPCSNDPKPVTDLSLLRQVHRYISERCPVDADLIVVGPRYVGVDVEAQIVPERPELGPGLIVASEQVLNRFLHPVNGGLEGKGWNFGKLPFASDLYAVLEDLRGIRFIRQLNLHSNVDDIHVAGLGDFIVCAGTHRIRAESGVIENRGDRG